MEQSCLLSFIEHGHEVHLYTYEDASEVPEGVIIKDAQEILDQSKIFKYKDWDSYAGFANLFRYALLYKKGGWWIDTDMVCLRPFDFDGDYVFSSQRERGGGVCLNNNVIKAPRKSEIMKICFETAYAKESQLLKWGETGPNLLIAIVDQLKLSEYIQPPQVFCPTDWWRWEELINPLDKDDYQITSSETYAVHLWNEMWRRNNIDKSLPYEKTSFYGNFVRK